MFLMKLSRIIQNSGKFRVNLNFLHDKITIETQLLFYDFFYYDLN